ncbi:hypothetical protein [Actinoplanes couchii]|uniref:Uncharacterized protein n=1 Tax=Actinoplanes couchii TaxID=403638 RepID=A0ABQ3XR71_9ACTN|nr:hypothetical protein [Actinoplanes couchii]MDR6318227.1 hypothetical protein [Actinoplanes couchii]GID61021.1 hypothetical protein Aco03nite_094250 [Actinoplanes couchii]
MSDVFGDLGSVRAPSGVLVLAMAGGIDYWPDLGASLSARAGAVAAAGGGHLRDGLCEAVAVAVADDRPLPVRASTSPSPFDEEPAVAVLEIGLGLPWPADRDRSAPVRLGDLPVDPCGTVIGDAMALDRWTGLEGESDDGLADVTYWGRYEEDAYALFGGERVPWIGVDGIHGWLDLPVAEAEARAAELSAWCERVHGRGLMVAVDEHTDFHRFQRAGFQHPLRVGAIEVGGCPVLGIGWDPGDYAMRHDGGREHGRVYPVTLAAGDSGETLLRWTIPPA